MTKPGSRTTKPSELKRISDYVNVGGGERLEGDRTELRDILGEDVTLTDFVILPGSDKYKKPGEEKASDFAVIQFKRAGSEKLETTSTGGVVIMRVLKETPKNYLPMTIRITQDKKSHAYLIE